MVVYWRMPLSFPPDKAWLPLAPQDWSASNARHLLRRAGWTARPEEVKRAVDEGLDATLQRLFPSLPARPPKPAALDQIEATVRDLRGQLRNKSGDERQRLERELRERQRHLLQTFTFAWLRFASSPEHAAMAKWTLFLSDVFVVSAEKVRHAGWIYDYINLLAQHGSGPAPVLAKAVSRSPAMVQYLDLNQSRRDAPNENFARELFELFVLGEGNYTESDIKEAARAFTGYRAQPLEGGFRFVRAQHDASEKTIFGVKGRFTGDDVVDLAYQRPAASTFLPREMARFYLSEAAIPAEHLAALGDAWRAAKFELRWLQLRFFGSQFFYAPEFRANLIKSPLQFYLGLLQDLQLDVIPVPRMTLVPLRQMGQLPFHPPNVRGWVGGRSWINSATIAARRQVVESLFAPINDATLNADDRAALEAARAEGHGNFTVAEPTFVTPDSNPAALAASLTERMLADGGTPDTRRTIESYLARAGGTPADANRAVRRAAATLLQSPEFQLC